jgi:hypothetical protein
MSPPKRKSIGLATYREHFARTSPLFLTGLSASTPKIVKLAFWQWLKAETGNKFETPEAHLQAAVARH